MTISAGDWTIFFTRPLSLTILIIAAGLVLGPKVWGMMRKSADTRAVSPLANLATRSGEAGLSTRQAPCAAPNCFKLIIICVLA